MTTRHRTDRHHLRVGDQTMRQPPRQTTVELAVALQEPLAAVAAAVRDPQPPPTPRLRAGSILISD